MIVVTILLSIAGVAAFYGAIKLIQAAVHDRYGGFLPFTKGTFAAFCIGYAMIVVGYGWYGSAVKSNGDALNGILMAIIGIGLLAWVMIRNIRSTSLLAGIGITAVQIPIFAIIAYFGLFILIFAFALFVLMPAVFRSMNPMTVRIVD